MNCPNCGKPVSPTANICSRCKTKIFHDRENDPNYNSDGTRKAVKLDEKRLKRNGQTAKTIFTILLILVIIIVALHFIFTDKLIEFAEAKKWGWYYWILTGEKFTGSIASNIMHLIG